MDISLRAVQDGPVSIEGFRETEEWYWDEQERKMDSLASGEFKDWTVLMLEQLPLLTVKYSYKSIISRKTGEKRLTDYTFYL